MNKVFCDSSSLILLTKTNLVNELVEFGNLFIGEKVFDEIVVKGKNKGKEDAFIVSKLVSEGKIKIVKLNDKKFFEFILKEFRLDEGEAEVIALAYASMPSIVFTDDLEAIKACKTQGIIYFTSLLFLVKLVREKKMSVETGLNKLEKLSRIGFYSRDLIKHVSEVIKKGELENGKRNKL